MFPQDIDAILSISIFTACMCFHCIARTLGQQDGNEAPYVSTLMQFCPQALLAASSLYVIYLCMISEALGHSTLLYITN